MKWLSGYLFGVGWVAMGHVTFNLIPASMPWWFGAAILVAGVALGAVAAVREGSK